MQLNDKKKLAIVCNSTNSDLVDYFICKASIWNEGVVLLKNKAINIKSDNKTYTSSYMKSAFFDKLIIVDFFLSFFLFFVVLRHRVSVIHFTTAHISNIFLSILLKPFRIKQIFTIHDLTPHPGRKSFFIRKYNDLIINFLADEIILFSLSEIKKQKKQKKFKYFPLTGFKLLTEKPKAGQRMVLFFGRMEPYKGYDNLYEVILLSNRQNLNYQFVIAGKGYIPNFDALNSLDNVTIYNQFISDDKLKSLFHRASFTLLPYDSATQSGVTILSYSYATPVIAYDVGALSEYIIKGKTGYCIPPGRNEETVYLLENTSEKEILKLSKCVISEFKKKYSVEGCQNQYKGYYIDNLNIM